MDDEPLVAMVYREIREYIAAIEILKTVAAKANAAEMLPPPEKPAVIRSAAEFAGFLDACKAHEQELDSAHHDEFVARQTVKNCRDALSTTLPFGIWIEDSGYAVGLGFDYAGGRKVFLVTKTPNHDYPDLNQWERQDGN